MIKLRFKLENWDYLLLPVFSAKFNDVFALRCLLDTGANLSVYTSTFENFESVFPSAIRGGEINIGGFGGDGTPCIIYTIPKLKFSDGKDYVILHNLSVGVTNELSNRQNLIFSGSLLNGSDLAIRFTDGADLLFDFKSKDLYCGLNSTNDKVYVFSSKEELRDFKERDKSADIAAAMRKSLESKKPDK